MTGGRREKEAALSEDELVDAVRFMAYVVVRYGDVYAPVFDRIERELEDLRRRRSPSERARRMLETYTIDAGLKQIC